MRFVFSVLILVLLSAFVQADVVFSNISIGVEHGNLTDDLGGFGTVIAGSGANSTTATLSAPVVSNGGNTITLSGTGSSQSEDGNVETKIDIDFDLTGCGCVYKYVYSVGYTATEAVEDGRFGMNIDNTSQTANLPSSSAPSPLMHQITDTSDTQSFGVLVTLDDTGGDGFDYDFTFSLVLDVQDPHSVECVPEPSSFLFLSFVGLSFVGWKRLHASSLYEA